MQEVQNSIFLQNFRNNRYISEIKEGDLMHWYDKTANSMKIVTKYSRQKMISILREDTSVLNDGSYQWAVEEGIVVFI